MLHAMSRNVLRLGPSILLWIPLVVSAPFAVACDALKKDNADAAVVAPAATTAAPAIATAPAAPVAVGVTPVAPLGGAVAPTPAAGVKPVAAVDGGKPVDGGAAAVDGGKTAPTPTPTFAIPTAIPGFDAGGFKPPAGFPTAIPSTLPTFPPPPK